MDRKETARLLIVEDEAFAREACELYLAGVGFDVESAANAEEATQRAGAHPPDVVISDWQLGGATDGVQLARQLQRNFGCSIVLMTAHALSELRQASRDLDVAASLPKPLSLASLARRLRGIIDSSDQ